MQANRYFIMGKYKFLVTEVLQGVMIVEANSREEAAKEAERMYENNSDDDDTFALNCSDCVDNSIKLINKRTKMYPITRRRNNL